jgi:hypothetical protein
VAVAAVDTVADLVEATWAAVLAAVTWVALAEVTWVAWAETVLALAAAFTAMASVARITIRTLRCTPAITER